MPLSPYLKKNIPSLSEVRNQKTGYRNVPIDSSSDKYSEELVDIRDHGLVGENYYYNFSPRPRGARPELLLRKSLVTKLLKVNDVLKREGLELYFFDCLRNIEVQNFFYDHWAPGEIKKLHQDWSQDKVIEEVNKYWARGTKAGEELDPVSPPPHTTGAAFDLTIRHVDGEMLDMGSVFDEMSPKSFTDYYEGKNQKEPRLNRRLLYNLMIEQGFANNPTEWWHFSYGDQMWAKLRGEEKAIYSIA